MVDKWGDEPDEILELPALTDTSDLQEEDALVIEEIVDLLKERAVAPDADVLLGKGREESNVSQSAFAYG